MKKVCAFSLAAFVAASSLFGCGGADFVYDDKAMMTPFWASDVIYNETVLLQSRDGELANGNLAFVPTGKIKVTDSTMSVTYEQGKDYTIEGRKITVTADTRMPWVEKEIFYGINLPAELNQTVGVSASGALKGYERVTYTEGLFLIRNQILVTYEYNKADFVAEDMPVYQGEKLPNTMQILRQKGCLNIVAYGDSISTGCNSTGGNLESAYGNVDNNDGSYYNPYYREPETPTFPEIFSQGLIDKYGIETTLFGAAKGGMNSDWGASNAAERVVNPDYGYDPDLVTVGFGMNDATNGISLDKFEENIRNIISSVRAKSEKTVEFILIGTMLANPDAEHSTYQSDYWNRLVEIANDTEGVAAVNIAGIHSLYLTNKSYQDMSANNVNHPNDFMIRTYGMALLQTLIQY